MTQRVRQAERIVRSNRELDARVRRLLARRLAGDELEARVGVKVKMAGQLPDEERQRYGFAPEWVPGNRRSSKRRTYYR